MVNSKKLEIVTAPKGVFNRERPKLHHHDKEVIRRVIDERENYGTLGLAIRTILNDYNIDPRIEIESHIRRIRRSVVIGLLNKGVSVHN